MPFVPFAPFVCGHLTPRPASWAPCLSGAARGAGTPTSPLPARLPSPLEGEGPGVRGRASYAVTAALAGIAAPIRSRRWSAIRSAFAMMVSAGLTELLEGKKLASTT